MVHVEVRCGQGGCAVRVHLDYLLAQLVSRVAIPLQPVEVDRSGCAGVGQRGAGQTGDGEPVGHRVHEDVDPSVRRGAGYPCW